MGTDPAPFMANLFLYFYESKFLKEFINESNVPPTQIKNKRAARKFGYV